MYFCNEIDYSKIPGVEHFLGKKSLMECSDVFAAKNVWKLYTNITNELFLNAKTYGCLVPCAKIDYSHTVKHYHKNLWMFAENNYSGRNASVLKNQRQNYETMCI